MTLPLVPLPFAPEILWFTPSEGFVQRPDHFVDLVSKGSGGNVMIRNYHGHAIDQPGSRVWVMVWKSLAHHRDFMEHEAYIDVALPVMEAMVGAGDITQVLLNNLSDFERALSAPVTQFIQITMRPWHDKSYELLPLIEQLKKDLKTIPGCFVSCWGPSVEKDTVHVGIVGWNSIDDRDAAVDGPLYNIIRQVRELSKVELRYARFNHDRHHHHR
ncbi:hypothetical protein NLJ89_g2545 [Agrocybe chaxingu]|uniref:Uncharacterized protein n=1 Tax=Agrocybe chaxingu TaxID=84603 RepID=A0A9W8K6D3_9AGAR|nr:hypothetical protein NLJ89_g2545 [Agrocybe chaxingu]